MSKPKLLVMTRIVHDLVRPDPSEFDILRFWEVKDDPLGWLAANGHGVRAILSGGGGPIDAALIATLPDLKLVAALGAGYQEVDHPALRAANVTLTNSSGINSADVADHAVGLMIAARRDMLRDDAWVRSGEWERLGRRPVATHSLSGEKAGIVGLGHIGMDIARRIEPIVAEIAWWGPRPKPDAPYPSFDSLLALARWASILFIAAPGGAATAKLVDRAVIDALGPQGLIVNVGRGTVIDEDALIAALEDGRLGMAALDVFEREPTPHGRWAGVPNTLLAPHLAGATIESIRATAMQALDNARRAYDGRPFVNVVP